MSTKLSRGGHFKKIVAIAL